MLPSLLCACIGISWVYVCVCIYIYIYTHIFKDTFLPVYAMKAYSGEELYLPSLITWALDGKEWLNWRRVRFTPGKESDTHLIGGWVGPRAGLGHF